MEVLAGITDQSEHALLVAQELQCPLLILEELLNQKTIKGVVIATPTPTHFPLALQVLHHGKNVLVEKPLAVRSEEISILESIADQQGLILMAGHLLLYHKAFQKLVDFVHRGELGKVLRVETSRKNLGKLHAHEGVLWDLGPHDFSMILSLMGQLPVEVLTHSQSYVYEGKPDIQSVLMRFKGGEVGEIGLSRLHPVKEQKVMVVGTKGSMIFDDTKDWPTKLELYSHPIVVGSSLVSRSRGKTIPLEPSEPLRDELSHFIECIDTQKIPLSSAEQAHQVLSLIQAAELSEKRKNWVPL
jgi:UDP-2-acetamido-3-amino-2,3-dideoxy-glucuronate N-acetyltransferase